MFAAGALLALGVPATAEIALWLRNVPQEGRLVVQIYDDADAFGAFRGPAQEHVLAARGEGEYLIPDSAQSDVAILVYLDENENGVLDRNFIGIPRERLGLSNGYRPKGPPSFDRAVVRLPGSERPRSDRPASERPDSEQQTLEIELFRVLGERGQWGAGLGVISRGSPYVDSQRSVVRPIPVITYIGERLQWFGPNVNYSLAGSGRARLALKASYRVGAYEEGDSPILEGLGDREDTVLVGLGLELDLPRGFELGLDYQHDALDRIGGGIAELELSRGFQAGIVRLAPKLILTWSSAEVIRHEFGVAASAERPDRPRYRPGSAASIGLGLSGFVELSESWRLILDVRGERLATTVRDSPIVAKDTVVGGFAAVAYSF